MSEWRPIETAPKDGSEIIVQLPAIEARAFWCEDLGCWILSSPIHIEQPSKAWMWRPKGGKLTTEELDILQFGRVLHKRPRGGK